MSIISNRDKEAIAKEFASLDKPVKLVNFTQEIECQYCRETSSLVKELGDLSDKVTTEVHNFTLDTEATEKYKIDKIPAIAFVDGEDYGLRFYIPSGYEFMTLLETIKMISTGESGLSLKTKRCLKELRTPVHLQVFVTPTCPHCTRAVSLAYKFAYESPLITADAIEIIEFPHLAQKYEVQGVPKTVISESVHLVGAVPEETLLDSIREALADLHTHSVEKENSI